MNKLKQIRSLFLKEYKNKIKDYLGCGISEREGKEGIRVYVEDKQDCGIGHITEYKGVPVHVIDSGKFHIYLLGEHKFEKDALEKKVVTKKPILKEVVAKMEKEKARF